MFVFWTSLHKKGEEVSAGHISPPLWPLQPWSPGLHQTSSSEVRPLTSLALAQWTNGLLLPLPTAIWQLYESSSHRAGPRQTSVLATHSAQHAHKSRTWIPKHRRIVRLSAADACNPQNNKTRTNGGHTNSSAKGELGVCLRSCDAEQWFLFIWSCAAAVCTCGSLYATVWKCVYVSAMQPGHVKVVLMRDYCSRLAPLVCPEQQAEIRRSIRDRSHAQ